MPSIKDFMVLGSWASVSVGVGLQFGTPSALIVAGLVGLFIAGKI